MSSSRLETLSFCLQNVLADKLVSTSERLGELTIAVLPADMLSDDGDAARPSRAGV